jgi:Zn-dependent protease
VIAMPPLFKFSNPIRIDKDTRIGQIRGVDTYIHWTVFVVVAFILAGARSHPGLSLVGLTAYFAVLLIHETGHLIAAQRLGCRVFSIKIYPIFGVTSFETPWSRFDHCLIAWAGVLAQAAIAIPLLVWIEVFGYSRFEIVNMLFAILGFFSAAIAVFNLLPFPRLDGGTAWGIFAAYLAQRRLRGSSRPRRY